MKRLPFSFLLLTLTAIPSAGADTPLLITISYHWYNAEAASAEQSHLAHVFSFAVLGSNGALMDSTRPGQPEQGCGRISGKHLRAVSAAMNEPSFTNAFANAAVSVDSYRVGASHDDVSVVIGTRVATFPRSSIPAPVTPLLNSVAVAHDAACNHPIRTFVATTQH
jgi:hypothetical protein